MTQTAKLTASDGGGTNAELGVAVAIDGSTVAVGAPQASVGVNADQGAAYVFSIGTSASSSPASTE